MPTLPQAVACVIVTFARLFANFSSRVIWGMIFLCTNRDYAWSRAMGKQLVPPGGKEVMSCTIPTKHTTISILQS